MSSRQNPTLPGETLVKLLSKSLKEQLVGTYVQVSAQRSFGMIALTEGLIRSFTAHDIYSLMGEVPDTLINGETLDISEFRQFKWYE